MRLSSPEFEDGGEIPEKYGYPKENVNPPLEISEVPEGTESLVLIMDDPDAMEPAGKIWDHWIVFDIDPATKMISEAESPGTEGETDYGEVGYGGPNPPDGEHTYVFRLYALDTRLELPEGASREEIEDAIAGHVVDDVELKGRYSPV